MKLLFVALAVFATCTVSAAEVIRYEITAYVDGEDVLLIQGSTLQWHHTEYAAVGRFGGANEPTRIRSWLDGGVVMDDVEWTPQWSELPPSEIRWEEYSSIFSGLSPALPEEDGLAITLTTLQVDPYETGRDYWNLIDEYPDASNGYTLAVLLSDMGYTDAAWHTIRIDVVPEPATLALLALGGLALVRRRRR